MKLIKSNLGWQRVLLIIVPYIIIVGAFQAIGMAIAGVKMTDSQNFDSIKSLIILFCGVLGNILILWFFLKIFDEKLIDLGFHLKKRGKDFIVGGLLGLVIMAGGFFILFITNSIKITSVSFNLNKLITSISIFIIVAFVEEALFRGYVLKNLMLSFNKYFALILSSLLFSLMHGFNPHISLFSLFDLFLAGIILGMTFVFTKNLWFAISLHFSWNLFQSLFGFNVSGQIGYSIINIKIDNPNLWNGGEFGFEGSILSIIMQLIIILMFFIYKNKFIKSHSHPKVFQI